MQRAADLLYIAIGDREGSKKPAGPWRFCGYDYGYYETETNYYSVLLSEIVFGAYDKLRALATHLNETLLLPSAETCGLVERTRNDLLLSGAGLEDDEITVPIAVYCHSR